MSVHILMDVHVRKAITQALLIRGVDVTTAQVDGSDRFSDTELLNRATALNRVLFTQDEDLLSEASKRQQHNTPFAGVIYAHQLRASIGQCISDLELIAKAGHPEDVVNRVTYLPL